MRYLVRRGGSQKGHYKERGGIWFEVVNERINEFNSNMFNVMFGKRGMHYGFIEVETPYYIYYNRFAEGYIPLEMYASVFHKPFDTAYDEYQSAYVKRVDYLEKYNIQYIPKYVFEEIMSKIEKNVADKLKSEGYDAVYVYTTYEKLPNHIFYMSDSVSWLS